MFKADLLDFSTLDASEREFFTIEYADPEFVDTLSILGGKVYLLINGLCDNFTAGLWIDGESVMELDEDSEDIVPTGEEKEPYYLDYAFTSEELNAIQWRLIQYMHCLIYDGEEYAIAEMSVPNGKEAWRKIKIT